MKFLCWNVRGLVKPSTQYEVLNLTKKHDISIFGVLETKLKESNLGDMMKNKFGGWNYAHNFTHHPGGRIVVAWDPSRVVFNPMTITHQLLHGKLICLVNKIEIHVSFVYALNKVILRRDLWHSLSSLGHDIEGPWTLWVISTMYSTLKNVSMEAVSLCMKQEILWKCARTLPLRTCHTRDLSSHGQIKQYGASWIG